jgi:selenocysteine lyase/cysteine desulfurase
VYVRSELARTLAPPMVSWMAPKGTDDFRRLRDYDMTWRDDARRFEFITLPYQDFAGMNASLDLFFEIGLENVARHVAQLADEIIRWTKEHDVQSLTPVDSKRRGGVICVKPKNAEKTSERLKSKGVVHSYREGGIRLSPHIYNTADDVRSALEMMA